MAEPKYRLAEMNDSQKKLLASCAIFCEATDFEEWMIRQRWALDGEYITTSWKDVPRISWKFLQGFSLPADEEGKVVVQFSIVDAGFRKIVFWRASSVVVNYDVIRKWMDRHFPSVQHTDPINFNPRSER